MKVKLEITETRVLTTEVEIENYPLGFSLDDIKKYEKENLFVNYEVMDNAETVEITVKGDFIK